MKTKLKKDRKNYRGQNTPPQFTTKRQLEEFVKIHPDFVRAFNDYVPSAQIKPATLVGTIGGVPANAPGIVGQSTPKPGPWHDGVRFRSAADKEKAQQQVGAMINGITEQIYRSQEMREKETVGRMQNEIEKLREALWQESRRHIADNIDHCGVRSGRDVLGYKADREY